MKRLNRMEAQAAQNRAIAAGELLIWTVYERPLDFPRSYIARPHKTLHAPLGALPVYLEADTLEAVRALLPYGLACLNRAAGDEPQILETWI